MSDGEADFGELDEDGDDVLFDNPSKESNDQPRSSFRRPTDRFKDLEEFARIRKWVDVTRGLDLDQSNLNNILDEQQDASSLSCFLWKRVRKPRRKTSLKLDMLNLYSAFLSVTTNGWGVEQIIVVGVCIGSTLAYCFASPATASEPPHLAVQLDFFVSV